MLFATYWFVVFAAIFFPIYWFTPHAGIRRGILVCASVAFYYSFAGEAGIGPILVLGLLTYLAGLSGHKAIHIAGIAICVAALVFYKYTAFATQQILAMLKMGQPIHLPIAAPLAISFFVFEFVHYLSDVTWGSQPIRSPVRFAMFAMFWPSVVSGPIKRYEQFIPAAESGTERVKFQDAASGFGRVIIGFIKKLVVADNLTAIIDTYQPRFASLTLLNRWLIFVAIGLRILADFSGYSDIAIGSARMMGISLPENFNWPYFASNLQEFWKRWHISLSTWIRDYVFFPLGGRRPVRRLVNVFIAFALCGLWHGAAWNFVAWGLYHGAGFVVSIGYDKALGGLGRAISQFLDSTIVFKYAITLLFVMVGWLYFFYPVGEAHRMMRLLSGLKP